SLVDERSLPGHLRCSSCSRPVTNSFQTPHGCRLCQSCVDSLPATDKVRCPGKSDACKDPDEEIDICQSSCFPDIASRRELTKLKVFCPNKSEGCRAEFPWRQADAHLADCEFEKVKCEMCGSCWRDGLRAQEPAIDVLLSGVQRSVSALPEGNFNRQAFLSHLSQCPQKPTPCRFAHLGCDFVAPAAEMAAHCSEAADRHLQLIDAKLRVSSASAQHSTASGFPGAAAAVQVVQVPQLMERPRHRVRRGGVQGDEGFGAQSHEYFQQVQRLQPNIATWALSTMSLEDFIKSFGGLQGFKTMLKNMDDKLRQMEAAERSGAGTTGASAASAAAASASSAEVSRLIEQMRAIELRFETLEQTSFDGCLTWKVLGFAARRREAKSGSPVSLFSPPFMSKRYGYMFRVRLFLNGQEGAEGSHVTIQLVLIQSEYEDVQDWPLVADVTFRLLHPRTRSDDVVAKATLSAQKPPAASDLSINASVTRFVRIDILEEKFVRNDSIYIETEVEPRPSEANRRVVEDKI
uniref:TNFR-Cys domain-containing protein n=1 Tax=Macrostomum lignano TaxID=282301 RepID=A0A1I8HJH6_9PLAT